MFFFRTSRTVSLGMIRLNQGCDSVVGARHSQKSLTLAHVTFPAHFRNAGKTEIGCWIVLRLFLYPELNVTDSFALHIFVGKMPVCNVMLHVHLLQME